MSYYRQQLEEWLKELDVKADTVLDIGGAQGPVKDRVKSWEVNHYNVVDLPDYDIERTQRVSMEMTNGDETSRFVKNGSLVLAQADMVFCLEVFEYLINPTKAMQNIYDCLNDGGKAYVTFAFVYPHHNELEADSLRYTEPGIKRLAEAAGLKVTNTWYRRDKSGLLKSFYAADGMRMAKQYPNHDVTGFICELTK